MQAIGRCGISYFSGCFASLAVTAMLFGVAPRIVAQANTAGDVSVATVFPSTEIAELQPPLFAHAAADVSLPDAPEPQQSQDTTQKPLVTAAGPTTTVPANTKLPMAPMYSRVIPAGMATPQIHKWDKMELAARNLYSATSFASVIVSAGWSHVTNGQPNYGTDSGAFGERLGASAIRDTTQAFLSNGPFAVWLHQDPRYFALGRQKNFMKRTIYAITRPLITRDSSDGHAEFNSSLVLGQAAGVGLSNLYYPESNRNFHDNIARFGGSMGGCALSFWLDEYTSELLKMIRLRQLERLMH